MQILFTRLFLCCLRINHRRRRRRQLECYGKLIAWKIDSHLAVLIETDVEHFTKLLIMTFLQNNLFINDQLPLMRIECKPIS